MRIIYGYSNCTDATYNRIVSERHVQTMVPDQKYHGLLIKGLAKNGAEVRCFSGLPVNRAVTARKLVREPDEQEGSAYFHYITTLNFPVIRQLMVFFGTLFGVLRTKKDKDTYAVCDFLNTATAMAFIVSCKLRRIKKTAIVTDIPDMFDSGGLSKKIRNFTLRRFDGYVLLTKYMKDFIPQDAPCIVLEGHADADVPAADSQPTVEEKEGTKVVLYAGNIHEQYGVRCLAEGFVLADLPDAELRIYGHGDFLQELERMSQADPRIRYMGTAPNAQIVRAEQQASLLVNPRPTAPEYTKYSFPSKNMEYMASGTPMLTTRLPGMPAEYEPYVYWIDSETPQGVADVLRYVLSRPIGERKQKGKSAQDFVLKEKTNVVQAKKLLDFLREHQS